MELVKSTLAFLPSIAPWPLTSLVLRCNRRRSLNRCLNLRSLVRESRELRDGRFCLMSDVNKTVR